MPYELRRMSRPLTDAERAKIAAAREKIEDLERDLAAATRERDAAILAAYNRRGKVTEIAAVAGVARQTVHTIVNQLAEN
jgi:DNA-directed RNA polymerase specialized sigma24 family protein